tara:strand:+ start:9241 stop:9945 length:705 start_codon:yes stop_codon:yes gene_type:complete
MLIIDVIDGEKTKQVEIPTDWEDITLGYWCGMYSIIKKHSDKTALRKGKVKEQSEKDEKDILEEFTLEHLDSVETVNMNKDLFQYVSGLSDEDIKYVDMDEATKALIAMDIISEEYKPKGIDWFDFEEERYFFPKDYMKKNTFGDYIESSQLEMYMESMRHGRFDVLPEQMAILCRRYDEEYDEDKIEAKAERFRELKMDIVWEFAFFLSRHNQRLLNILEMYSEEREQVEEVV